MPIRMKHVSMMHACVMHVKNGDGRTDGKLKSKSRMLNVAQDDAGNCNMNNILGEV